MPIEAGSFDAAPTDGSVAAAFLAEAQATLTSALAKIAHCLDQLSDDDVWWRPHESHNSLQNIILHLCGNLRQWIGCGLGGLPDVRDRPAEFSDRQPISKPELLKRLTAAVEEAKAVLAAFPADRILERRKIQGFDTTLLAALFDTVSHFVGHTHQIVYITRLRLGDAYRFQWTPASPEQGAPREAKSIPHTKTYEGGA